MPSWIPTNSIVLSSAHSASSSCAASARVASASVCRAYCSTGVRLLAVIKDCDSAHSLAPESSHRPQNFQVARKWQSRSHEKGTEGACASPWTAQNPLFPGSKQASIRFGKSWMRSEFAPVKAAIRHRRSAPAAPCPGAPDCTLCPVTTKMHSMSSTRISSRR